MYLINSVVGNQVTQLQHAATLNNILFSPDSTLLATAASDGMVYLWQTSNGIPILHFAHAGTVTKMRFSTNGERLITITTTAKGDNVYLWDAIRGKAIQRFRYTTAVDEVNFIAGTTRFVVITESNTIR